MSAEDNAPTNPDGNTDAAVISSCDDLPADVVDADGLVLVRGPIICHQTKVRMDGRIFSLVYTHTERVQQTTYTRSPCRCCWSQMALLPCNSLDSLGDTSKPPRVYAELRCSSSVYVSLFASVARMKKQENFPRASEQKNSRALFRICTTRKGLEFQTKMRCTAEPGRADHHACGTIASNPSGGVGLDGVLLMGICVSREGRMRRQSLDYRVPRAWTLPRRTKRKIWFCCGARTDHIV